MKKPLAFLTALAFAAPLPAFAESQRGYSTQRTCTKEVYREEYTPGTADRPGFVRSWSETVEVPCEGRPTQTTRPWTTGPRSTAPVDDNSCVEGSIIGGLLGGALGGVLSRDDGRWWAIPSGVAGGAMVGCQIDGG